MMTDAERNQTVTENMGLAVSVAERLLRQYAGHQIPLKDLIQEAAIGLMRACDTYDPARGRYATYAYNAAFSRANHFCRRHVKRRAQARQFDTGSITGAEVEPPAPQANDHDAAIDAGELWDRLKVRLSPQHRDAVERMVFKGDTCREYGERCGFTPQNASRLMIVARERIKKIIAEDGVCAADYGL
jgi:RNA polymerase sigma factor (sigma-70 family)